MTTLPQRVLGWLIPEVSPPSYPKRIVFVQPCCIGDVVMATAALGALRQHYPHAHITWAVGEWSRAVVEHHPHVDELLHTGMDALPVHNQQGFRRFVKQISDGHFELAVSLVRSFKMSTALLLAGVKCRVGLDSNGRGYAYNMRVPLNPDDRRHEVEIYLDVVRALGADVANSIPYVPVDPVATAHALTRLSSLGLNGRFVVLNPNGGTNPGATMTSKRYPPANFARLLHMLKQDMPFEHIIVVGGKGDKEVVAETMFWLERLQLPATAFVGELSFAEIGSMAHLSCVYMGNDTGLTHYAAASGALTVMILGPSDPLRYRPYSDRALGIWKPYEVDPQGVVRGEPLDWQWARDGIAPDDAAHQIAQFLRKHGEA